MGLRAPFTSLKNRLALLFFLITAGAILIVYVYVVPQLKSSLISEKQKTLNSLSGVYSRPLQDAMRENRSNDGLDALVRRLGQRSGARVTLLGTPGGGPRERNGRATGIYVIADSRSLSTAVKPNYRIAERAIDIDKATSGTDSVGNENLAQVARPLDFRGSIPWVAIFSTDLEDVSDNVNLIQQKILVAGALALLGALIIGYLAARAITKRAKRLEQAAEAVAAGRFTNPIPVETEDELGKLALAFNEMQRRLKRLDQARKQFITNASHELRTPLFSLGGFVELLQDEDLDQETKEEFINAIGEQVERLTKLATNLLDLSQMDAGALQLQMEEVDLPELAQSIAGEFRPVAAQRGVEIDLGLAEEDDAAAVCDAERTAQIIRILLDNALSHTPPGTPVAVSAKRNNGTAEIAVEDYGPGIPTEEQQHIFDRFYSGDAGKGTGLGLTIARELAQHMDGKLEVHSRPGHTEFKLELPAA